MPASLPGATLAQNQGIPTQGSLVMLDCLSGPKAAPLDASKIDYTTGTPPGWNATTKIPIKLNDPLNLSTGALSTGVGFGGATIPVGVVKTVSNGNFTDDYAPGISTPTPGAAVDSRYLYVGGGKSLAGGAPVPYTAGFGLCAAGKGAAREASAKGFATKLVTAPGAVAVDAVVETGFVNRTGVAMTTGQSTFGVASAALAAPA